MNVPFTPFHFGIALPLFLWDWKKKRVDAVSALVGTVIIDIRAFYLFIFTNNTNYHGILHSFISATILGVLVGLFVHFTYKIWKIPLKWLQWDQDTSLFSKILTGVVLANSHILLDAALYPEMNLFWPFPGGNALYGWLDSSTVLTICVDGFLVGVLMYFAYLIWSHFRKSKALGTQGNNK